MKEKNKAIILMIVSAIAFAVMSTFVKLSGDLPSIEKSLFRNVVSCIVAFYLVKKSGDSLFGKKENRKYLIGRALLGTIGVIANFYAIEHLILADANMLNQLSPFFTIIFSSLFLREKITKNQIIILLIAFAGSLFIIRPTFSLEIIPALIGLSSAIFAGGAYTFVRFLGGREKGPTIVFFFSFFSIVSTLPFVLVDFKPFTMIQLFYLLMAGVAASIAQFALTAAYKHAPAREISIYSYTQIVFTALIGFTIFDQLPTAFSFIGYAIVIIASIGMFMYNNKMGNNLQKSSS
ncbi:DMT family transporter [Clostridium sardiniense]|uniref:DMT family transporter n=1 Tax=Clostridium sardiniense TaxID=29369 RepID=A0ABS7L183_CLOSR|nr:DMT family transporter [Clostridium sardiniense]MBY0756633.1 DMT family transporter [Clostridium sardiniense]MDQ0458621.1 drug/metabolite transporter (DMT)-like permease [Clostridium sardiniense]